MAFRPVSFFPNIENRGVMGYNEHMRKRETKAILLILTALLLPAPRWLSPQAAKGLKPGAAAFKNPAGKEIRFYKKSFALLVGVWDYQYWRKFSRENIEGDLEKLKTALEKQAFEVDTVLNPTSTELRGTLENFRVSKGLDRDFRLLILFSGHGYSRGNFTKGYIVPRDAPLPRENLKGFLAKAVDMIQLRALAQRIEARHVLFLFDSCFSGTIFRTKSEPVPEAIEEEMTHLARQFITAGKARQMVPEKSVFMPALIRGIGGKADIIPDRFITGVELFLYIQDQVKKSPVEQHPQYGSLNISNGDGEGNMVFEVQKPAILLPPPAPDLDVTAQVKWSEWQSKFDRDVEGLKQLDEKTGVSSKVKLQNWVKLKEGYKVNNPFSSRDEEHRAFIRKKIRTWKEVIAKEKAETAPGKKNSTSRPENIEKDKKEPLKQDVSKAIYIALIQKPKCVSKVEPVYPPIAINAHIQGNVIIKLTTDIYGRVVDAVVINGHAFLKDAAVKAVRQWRYEPYLQDGEPRAVRFTVVVKFNLQNR